MELWSEVPPTVNQQHFMGTYVILSILKIRHSIFEPLSYSYLFIINYYVKLAAQVILLVFIFTVKIWCLQILYFNFINMVVLQV